jgi:hypothetical protein
VREPGGDDEISHQPTSDEPRALVVANGWAVRDAASAPFVDGSAPHFDCQFHVHHHGINDRALIEITAGPMED